MTNDAQVFLSGYVASDPKFRTTRVGTPTASLRVAYTLRRLDRETGEWSDGQTTFISVVCWRTLAKNVALCLRKGEPVLVRGRLQIRRYADKDGVARFVTEIDASSIGHDLARGVALFQRLRRAPAETAAEGAEGAEGIASGGADGALGALPGTVPGLGAAGREFFADLGGGGFTGADDGPLADAGSGLAAGMPGADDGPLADDDGSGPLAATQGEEADLAADVAAPF